MTLRIPTLEFCAQTNKFLGKSSHRKHQLSFWKKIIVPCRHHWDSTNLPVLLCPSARATSGHIHSNDRASDHGSPCSCGQCLTFTEHLRIHQLICSFQSPGRWAGSWHPFYKRESQGPEPFRILPQVRLLTNVEPLSSALTRVLFSGPLHL